MACIVRPTGDELAEDIEHFREYGWPDWKIEERLGLNRGTIALWQRRHNVKEETGQPRLGTDDPTRSSQPVLANR
jgi:hypothetical protein